MEIMTLEQFINNLIDYYYDNENARNVTVRRWGDCAIGGGGVREGFLSEQTPLTQAGHIATQFEGTMPDSGVNNATVVSFGVVHKGKRKEVIVKRFFKWV